MTALYRIYDKNDRLLYIGISGNWLSRLNDHQCDKSWFKKSTRTTMKHYAKRDDALAAEKLAIKKEKPIYNVVHNQPRSRNSNNEIPRGRDRFKFGVFWVDKSVAGIVRKMEKMDIDIACAIDSLILVFLRDGCVPDCFTGTPFKKLTGNQKKRIKLPVDCNVNNKIYQMRYDHKANEVISDMLMAYQENGYKVPEYQFD